jgi:transcriptional regulator with XRE-family HTH domain
VIAPSDRPDGVGGVIRRQRELAHMSVRQLARVSKVSNAYLSQIERGLHAPSLRVLSAVSEALSVSMEDLLVGRVGTAPVGTAPPPGTQDLTAAIKAEPRLSTSQKEALLAVYRGFLQQGSPPSDHG